MGTRSTWFSLVQITFHVNLHLVQIKSSFLNQALPYWHAIRCLKHFFGRGGPKASICQYSLSQRRTLTNSEWSTISPPSTSTTWPVVIYPSHQASVCLSSPEGHLVQVIHRRLSAEPSGLCDSDPTQWFHQAPATSAGMDGNETKSELISSYRLQFIGGLF